MSSTGSFTFWDGAAPHHLSTVQLTSDGFGSLGLNEAILADDGDGAAQLETVTKTPGVQWDAWIWTLVMAKCGVSDVESSAGHGVVRLELQPQDVAVAGEM